MNKQETHANDATITIEFTVFTRMWKAMGLTANDLLVMQDQLFKVLTTAPPVRGCCGARKMRFALSTNDAGKSGGARIIFKYLSELHTVILVVAYPKNVQDNISDKDKNEFCKTLNAIEAELIKRLKKGTP